MRARVSRARDAERVATPLELILAQAVFHAWYMTAWAANWLDAERLPMLLLLVRPGECARSMSPGRCRKGSLTQKHGDDHESVARLRRDSSLPVAAARIQPASRCSCASRCGPSGTCRRTSIVPLSRCRCSTSPSALSTCSIDRFRRA